MILKAAAVVLAAGLSTAAIAAGPAMPQAAFKAAQTQAKSGPSAKMGPILNTLYQSHSAAPAANARSLAAPAKASRLQKLLHAMDGHVSIDIALTGDAEKARGAFEAYGLTDVSTFGTHLSGRAPIGALASISQNAAVITMRPALSRNRAGLTQTQGDKAQRSDDARKAFGVTGAGVKVGVMSDSINCTFAPLIPDPEATFTTYAQDVANGDLPRVQILKDDPEPDCSQNGTDEGRAILQLVHDVAPGSPLAFHTTAVSETDFAAGVVRLANAGAKIIVDDVIYFAEPMFQDGMIAQAVDSVKKRGVTYFSSAGNDARQSYEAAFKRSNVLDGTAVLHNFGTKAHPDVFQQASLDPDSITVLAFQWSEPYGSISAGGKGSRSDVDIAWLDNDTNLIPFCNDNLEPAICQIPGIENNVGGDPYEQTVISNSTDSTVDVNLIIELASGPAPDKMKYVWFDFSNGIFHLDEFVTDSGTAYGHANAAGAEAVGAAPWYNTAEFGSPLWGNPCKPACLEYFSSAGGVPILFDKNGNRLKHPVVRLKPGVTGPDGGNTSFFLARFTDPVIANEPDQYPNFFGTSASAPHVAAIAALMLDQMKRNGQGQGKDKGRSIEIPTKLVPDFLISTLRATSSDVRNRAGRTIAPFPIENSHGYDFDSGFGFVDAAKALTVVKALRVSSD